jgi:lipoprotein-anchoring transpeptidase ErfK/SrfK
VRTARVAARATVLVAALAIPGPAAAPASVAAARTGAQEDFALSDPAAHTWRWATVERRAAARAAPARRSAVVARLSRWTPERTPEAVPLLARRAVNGRLWIKVRLPVLPNGSTGWVRRGRLGGYETVRTHLVVDRRRLTARLERRGRTVFRARIGIGQPSWPTPAGRFMVRNRLIGFTAPVYGALAFGTTARSATLTDWPGGGFVGIHGTDRPGILPGRVSHGCIRMRNADIRRLDRRMPVGTPVTVR